MRQLQTRQAQHCRDVFPLSLISTGGNLINPFWWKTFQLFWWWNPTSGLSWPREADELEEQSSHAAFVRIYSRFGCLSIGDSNGFGCLSRWSRTFSCWLSQEMAVAPPTNSTAVCSSRYFDQSPNPNFQTSLEETLGGAIFREPS